LCSYLRKNLLFFFLLTLLLIPRADLYYVENVTLSIVKESCKFTYPVFTKIQIKKKQIAYLLYEEIYPMPPPPHPRLRKLKTIFRKKLILPLALCVLQLLEAENMHDEVTEEVQFTLCTPESQKCFYLNQLCSF
jgi:hypothetical protein